MAKRATVDAKMFSCVKTLLKGGAPYREIEDYLGLSASTIGRIAAADTLEEYKQELAASALRWSKNKIENEKKKAKQIEMQLDKQEQIAAQVVEHHQTVTIQATHYMMEEMKKTNELLTLISAKLAFMVEELSGKPQTGGDKP